MASSNDILVSPGRQRHPVGCGELLARWRSGDQRAQALDRLSGGQRQRLFIALAFVNSPEVVFLDEPGCCLVDVAGQGSVLCTRCRGLGGAAES